MSKVRWFNILILAAMIFVISGCAKQTSAELPIEKAKLVNVQEIKEDILPVRLKYTGMTSSGEVKKYSFKVPGKISEISVKKGSAIHTGQKLASVSTTELSLALQDAQLRQQLAEKAYLEAKDSYAKYEQLFKAGALPQDDLNKAKLGVDLKETDYNRAKIDVEAKRLTLGDADLYADMEGVVVDVLFKQGEILSAGYPVVVVRAGEQKLTVGLSQNDVKKIKEGTLVQVSVDGIKAQGRVSRIDAVPDTQSRTYTTEVSLTQPLPEEQFYIGATANVEFEIGGAKGIWVPLASVLNDGEDYLYVIEDQRAVKRNIKLLDVQGFNVRVEGVKPGELLVTTGMKALKEGTKVEIQSAGESK